MRRVLIAAAVLHGAIHSITVHAQTLSRDRVDVRAEQSHFWESLLIGWIPMLFLIGVFVFFMRRLGSIGDRIREEKQFRDRVEGHLQQISTSLVRLADSVARTTDKSDPPSMP